ncbi:hypothetical protein Y1Q_0003932 [Alligator mississippiensis]|uniref:Uncharacterized protein n=1 Tax=Alligator mississippiensis TaxID=8496 RepID=A0A151MZI4_ALLMI|nr:hypothetical protein Y1Q_0003932 [Alligator mississippiensis]
MGSPGHTTWPALTWPREIISGARSLECAIELHRRPAEQTCQRGHGNPGNPATATGACFKPCFRHVA